MFVEHGYMFGGSHYLCPFLCFDDLCSRLMFCQLYFPKSCGLFCPASCCCEVGNQHMIQAPRSRARLQARRDKTKASLCMTNCKHCNTWKVCAPAGGRRAAATSLSGQLHSSTSRPPFADGALYGGTELSTTVSSIHLAHCCC
jgi:hypothetical protein